MKSEERKVKRGRELETICTVFMSFRTKNDVFRTKSTVFRTKSAKKFASVKKKQYFCAKFLSYVFRSIKNHRRRTT